jgi:hypothetical protein
MTFCWLPPESVAIGCFGSSRERMLRASCQRRYASASALEVMNCFSFASRGQDGALMFSATGRTMNAPSRWRSAGSRPTPASIA